KSSCRFAGNCDQSFASSIQLVQNFKVRISDDFAAEPEEYESATLFICGVRMFLCDNNLKELIRQLRHLG
ncbi:hypothetical protein BaRGS_00003027, partial [Batillaria attramentaria]